MRHFSSQMSFFPIHKKGFFLSFKTVYDDINFVALTFTTPRNASELKLLHCEKRMDISHRLLFISQGERIAD